MDGTVIWISPCNLLQVFSTPYYHPKSKPFVDHTFYFGFMDNRIWFRNYQVTISVSIWSELNVFCFQIVDKGETMTEIGQLLHFDNSRCGCCYLGSSSLLVTLGLKRMCVVFAMILCIAAAFVSPGSTPHVMLLSALRLLCRTAVCS